MVTDGIVHAHCFHGDQLYSSLVLQICKRPFCGGLARIKHTLSTLTVNQWTTWEYYTSQTQQEIYIKQLQS